jgi:hypothetical protein
MGYSLAALPTAQAAEDLPDDPTRRILRFAELPSLLAAARQEVDSKLSKSD